MPKASMNTAIAYYEGDTTSIYILYVLRFIFTHICHRNSAEIICKTMQFSGGETQRHGMVVYNGNNFREYGDEFLEFLGNEDGESGQGNGFYTQTYYQNTTTLFTLPHAAEYIHFYDLIPETLSFRTLEPAIPITVADSACLASSNTPSPRLYITGGYMNFSNYYEI